MESGTKKGNTTPSLNDIMYIIGHLSMVGQFLIYALVYLEPSGQSCRDPRLFFIAAIPIAPLYAVKLCFATSRSCRDTLQWPLGRQAG